MIPRNFEYLVPRTLDEAASLLQKLGPEAKILAMQASASSSESGLVRLFVHFGELHAAFVRHGNGAEFYLDRAQERLLVLRFH